MAPEIIDNNGLASSVRSACDIWSLGCTVIELLTMKPPYFDLNPYTAMFKIVSNSIPLPESCSDDLKDFFSKCFEKDPFKRIDAKGLLEHRWIKKYDKNFFQRII
jgi:serine/threonine protein kinase